MNGFLVTLGSFLALVCLLAFVVGIIMLFFESSRKLAGKVILYAVIGFVIGFGTCAANLG
ncbi:hypothetical protein B0A58_03335 [Flavobacterium branchiophilum NBRC 15030 = ATCC 35035]|uniref:Uncharacterized protein n=1 Tax=Flavobacterium branchiophilum TaxID=55197 RepID=A0A543G8L1_9FLAO|nr:hypothetical protein [Flavobacterium branchiophilum]OXA79444.1 hypothetical protein B0A58_03335 [Flavobacterium branchiophilum NBRC 15030 = ATCC 35035]TQM42426.1 hypothetical protein BC670_3487 [Flavobacterium branchiophilum]GEM54613.1 hypothetical protein FB1_08340 [Flavobacterium branchiophilum NBRC 15030 = ATCC 35035]